MMQSYDNQDRRCVHVMKMCVLATVWLLPVVADTATPSVEQALRMAPSQRGVEIDRPNAGDVAKCSMAVQRLGGQPGFLVKDPAGVPLRWFADTNGDKSVDQWSYFKDGLEVYRDIDVNSNRKVDQCRWLHIAGIRWGLDKDEDGTIDAWKMISAEEVTEEVIAALATRDTQRFARLVLTPSELNSLGAGKSKAEQLAARLQQLTADFQNLVTGQKTISKNTKWVQFSANQPGILPAGTDGSTKDIRAYGNVMAIGQDGDEYVQVQIGELIHVGEVWRVIDLPQVMDEAQTELTHSGLLFQASMPDPSKTSVTGPSEKLQKLLGELEELDEATAKTTAGEQQTRFNARRADLLEEIAEESRTREDRAMWLRQMADTISAAVQSGTYADGVERLDALFEQLQRSESDTELAAYVKFRRLSASYGQSMLAPNPDFAKIQTDWYDNLKKFAEDYPASPNTAEALLQLAIADELAGQEDDASRWYDQVVKRFPGSSAAKKATGALSRLNVVGKSIRIRGRSLSGDVVDTERYRGRVLLLHYWATWGESYETDMSVLKNLVARHGSAGFSVVGISVDNAAQELSDYLAANRLPWPQIFEPGGLDSRPANELGILTIPTMILIGKDGRVVNRNVQIANLEREVQKLMD